MANVKTKTILKFLLLGPAFSLFTTSAIWAAEDPHAGHHPTEATSNAPMVNPVKRETTSDTGMMSNMHKMRDQMAKLKKTTDGKERARLLDEHMKTMQSTMDMMRKSDGCMMGGMGGSDKSMSMSSNGGGKSDNADMMQMMMDQMMEHQKAMSGAGH